MFAGAAAIVTDDCIRPTPHLDVQLTAVDSSCVVPMNAIPIRTYAAYSIRPRIHKQLGEFLRPVPEISLRHRSAESFPEHHTEVTPATIPSLVASCEIDLIRSRPQPHFLRRTQSCRKDSLPASSKSASAATRATATSLPCMRPAIFSPYLHWGHISSLEAALAAKAYAAEHKLMAEEFLEELIVRRELAFNFTHFTANRETLDVLPDWARKTIHDHRNDTRDPLYTREQFETATTHDDLWNATQKEMRLRGKIHGYYRMYWGKKIIEWSRSAADAHATMLYIHDRFALDADDPNTYGNILWCFGLHDRPWPERPIYGTIRSMVRSGMERKTNVKAYLKEIEYLERTGKELTP